MTSLKPSTAYKIGSWQPKRLQDFASDMKRALDAVTPMTQPYYRDVSVLAIHWQNDQMGFAKLNATLMDVFKTTYNFRTEQYEIPTNGSYWKLNGKLLSWCDDNARRDTLRIVIYSGYAEYPGTKLFKWHIAGRADRYGCLESPTVDWRRITGIVDNTEGDVVYILGCCSADPVVMDDSPETISATSWDLSATANVTFSFTQGLIDTLEDLKGAPETVAGIYARLFRNAYQNGAVTCPVHVPKYDSPSITLQRLQPLLEGVQKPWVLRVESNRVLISVKISDGVSEHDLSSWTKWLTDTVPPGALSVDVRIEAALPGLMLVTMPVQLWTMLPVSDTSYGFVAHVNSNSTLPRLTRTLPMRPAVPPSGPENQPFC